MSSAREYATDRIRNVAVLGHGGSGKTSLVDVVVLRVGHVQAPRQGGRRYRPHHARPRGARARDQHPAHPGLRRAPGHEDQPPGHAGLPGLHRRGPVGRARGGRRHHCRQRHLGRRGGNGAGLGVLRGPGNSPDLFCLHDGQGARRLRGRLPADQGAPDREGASRSRSPWARVPTSTASSTSSARRPTSSRRGRRPGSTTRPASPTSTRRRSPAGRPSSRRSLATTDEKLLEAYLEGGHISREEAIEAMARGMARGDVFPVFCGARRSPTGCGRCCGRSSSCARPRRGAPRRRRTGPASTRTSRSTPPTTRRWPPWSSRRPRSPTWASCPTSGSSPARSPTAWRW